MTRFLRRNLDKLSVHALLIPFALLTLIPLLWMVSVSFKKKDAVFNDGIWLFPKTISLEGYMQVFAQTPIMQWTFNSLFLSSLQTVGQIILAFLGAYALARLSFPGKNFLFYFILAAMMIPEQIIMVPKYITINMFDWINTFKGVIFPNLASAYAIFFLRQFFMGVPGELADAASVDGCGEIRILWHIYLRLILPALFALGIILFVGHWNDFYWPMMIITDKEKLTLPLALVQFKSEKVYDWVPTMAVATLSTLPVLLLYFFAQKKFIEGYSHSGLKG